MSTAPRMVRLLQCTRRSCQKVFPAIAAMSPVWAAVVQAWDGLEKLYVEHRNRGVWDPGRGVVLGPYQSAVEDVIWSVR